MKIYLLSAAGVIFLSIIVSLIIPEGKLNKTIVFVMRLVCILVLLQPITGLFKFDYNKEAEIYDAVFICKVYSDNQSKQLEKLLNDKFGEECDCLVEVVHDEGNFKANSVTVEINNEDDKNINNIYEYLEELGYINITVYAKSY